MSDFVMFASQAPVGLSEGVLHPRDGSEEECLRYALVSLSLALFPINDDHMLIIDAGSTAKVTTSSTNSMSVPSS